MNHARNTTLGPNNKRLLSHDSAKGSGNSFRNHENSHPYMIGTSPTTKGGILINNSNQGSNTNVMTSPQIIMLRGGGNSSSKQSSPATRALLLNSKSAAASANLSVKHKIYQAKVA